MHRRLNLRDAFPKSVAEYNQQVERFLQLRRAGMDAAWEELEEGWAANNKLMVRFGLTPRADDEGVVKLNVGGLNVTVCSHLLLKTEGFEGSILGALLEGLWDEGRIPRDADGRIVLDESPACIKHIIARTTLRAIGRASSVAEGLPESSTRSAVATDEVPCLIYTAYVMGLPESLLARHPKYVDVNGGSTILEPFEIAPFGAKIREWTGGSTDEMTLIYRATRDGFDSNSFGARCDTSSPNTISLIRVSSGQGNDNDDSVVGSRSVFPVGEEMGSVKWILGSMFLFLLKDGNATPKGVNTPIKWHPRPGSVDDDVTLWNSGKLFFGGTDLFTPFDEKSGGCTIITGRKIFEIEEDSPFLKLNGKTVVDIEVYRYSTPAPPTTIAPSVTEPGSDVLTDAEAYDVRSFGEPIASSLMEERVILNRAVKEMEAAGARVSAAVSALKTVYGPSVAAGEQDAVVELNVRGTRMTTLRSTLQACPHSALATMFNEERWPATGKDKDENGRRLIDCDPSCFSKTLDVLRMRKRASWSRGVAPDKQKGESGNVLPGGVLIKEADIKAVGEIVNKYFPGCESFIMDLMQWV